MKIKTDCRFMRWDRPCDFHKREGVRCGRCRYYAPVKNRLLVVKLDALGDVLRTTCILPGLKEKYPGAHLTWITMENALPLLENNPFIDRTVGYGPDALSVLAVERFHRVFCLDAAPRSAALGAMARGKEKRGFLMDPCGRVVPVGGDAEEWLRMGLFDDVKKKNTRTYQDMVMGVCGLSGLRHEIVLRLTAAEREFARRFAARAGIPAEAERRRRGVTVVGINTGSGGRWPMKQWSENRSVELIRSLIAGGKSRVLLFGGEEEKERNRRIARRCPRALIDTGCGNGLREFIALVDLCDLLVTSDTLGLHAALGLGKKVVAIFGPTSAAEIDLYGRGAKVVPDIGCSCCYRRECGRTPSCMDLVSVRSVREAVEGLLE